MSRSRPADHLFDRVVDFGNLVTATRRCARGKRERHEVAVFLAGLEGNLLRLKDELIAGIWRPGGFRSIEIRGPKPRTISVAPFADRVVHQALCAVLVPVLERGYIDDSYASRKGLGQHRAIARFEQFRDRFPWVLRTDIWRYFPSIDHELLKSLLRRRVACERTLALADTIIDGSNPQQPVQRYFPGDDLFTPIERRRGLPLGNLTSQVFGNFYLDAFDHYAKEVLHAEGYVRYLDDIVVFGRDAESLRSVRDRLQGWLDRRRLMLHPVKTRILLSGEAQPFLGFELHPGGYRRLLPEQLARAQSRIDRWRQVWARGEADEADVRRSLGGWVAHARHADTFRLRCALFPGGWCRPGKEPSRPRTPVARRRVEQRTDERALGQPQRRRPGESQQQHGSASHQ